MTPFAASRERVLHQLLYGSRIGNVGKKGMGTHSLVFQ
jgi:hypothetical protein